tara:strand:+ start:749 stop:1177 length:429 start_codon:yes stop_codon:yes gene_type:complete
MIWVIRIILLAILVAIIRNWPKTSVFIAFVILIIYINSDDKQADRIETNKIENVQNPNNLNKLQTNSNSIWDNNTYQSNENNNTRNRNNYKPSKTNLNSYKNYNYEKVKVRVGAVCRDGTTSTATGRGACSHHGGVDYWLYE